MKSQAAAAGARRDIPVTNEIGRLIHCPNCRRDKPDGMSWREWLSIEVGVTTLGFQVWCRRCEVDATSTPPGRRFTRHGQLAKKLKGGTQ